MLKIMQNKEFGYLFSVMYAKEDILIKYNATEREVLCLT